VSSSGHPSSTGTTEYAQYGGSLRGDVPIAVEAGRAAVRGSPSSVCRSRRILSPLGTFAIQGPNALVDSQPEIHELFMSCLSRCLTVRVVFRINLEYLPSEHRQVAPILLEPRHLALMHASCPRAASRFTTVMSLHADSSMIATGDNDELER